MFLPSADQYSFAIQHKAFSSLYFLNDHHFLKSCDKGSANEWIFCLGHNAVIFKASCEGKLYAVRCFLQGDHETFRRYEILAGHFSAQPFHAFAPFEFLEKEILVEGQQYPMLQMEWIEGTSFHHYLDAICHDTAALTAMQEQLLSLSHELEHNGIGHGDINLEHLMVVQQKNGPALKLVDYDSVYIPAFEGLRSLGAGSPGFQHPARLATDYSAVIDRFSIWIFLAGLEAIKIDPLLWENASSLGYQKSQNLLFTYRDLLSPTQSRMFRKLHSLKSWALEFYLGKILHFCEAEGPVAVEAPVMFDMFAGTTIVKQDDPVPPEKDTTSDGPKEILIPEAISTGKKAQRIPIQLKPEEKEPVQPAVKQGGQLVKDADNKKPSIVTHSGRKSNREQKICIQEFMAGSNRISQGELATLNWKVDGDEPIYITNIGKINERTGQIQLVLTQTTRYELRCGHEKKEIVIHVDRKKEQESAPHQDKGNIFQGSGNKKWLIPGIVLFTLALSSIFYLNSLPSTKNAQASLPIREALNSQPASSGIFVPSGVKSSLVQLFEAYNRRDLPSIMSHYSNRLQEYYESRAIGRDSLARIIRNLFIAPAYYHCSFDPSAIEVRDEGTFCVVRAVLHETLQQKEGGRKESYNTSIEYTLNTNLKIISEKRQD